MHRLDRGRGPPENRESRPADTGAALERPFSDIQFNTTKARRRQARVQVRASNSLIKAFVDCVFKHADAGTYVMMRAFRDDNKTYGRWKPVQLNADSRKDLAWTAFKAAETCAGGEPGRPVFCPPIATFKNPYGNRANTANLANGLVLTVDCDTASPAAVAKLCTLLRAPTLTVASGGKWTDDAGAEHDKLHLHWRLKTPTRTPEEHELLRQARVLAAHIAGGDLSAGPPVHPIRWPGSIHRKSEPRLCRVIDFTDNELDLDSALVLLEAVAPRNAVAKRRGKGKPGESNESLIGDIRDVQAALAAIPNEKLDYQWWNYMLMMIWGATGGSDDGREAAHIFSAKLDGVYDALFTDERWDHFAQSPPTRVGAGSLIYLAREADPDFRTMREKADDDIDGVFEAGGPMKATSGELRNGGQYKLTNVEWLWPGWLARGKLHILGGRKSGGKSTVFFSLAAIVTTGGKWPDGSRAPLGDVVIWSSEDAIDDTILPRIAAMGGNINRVYFVDHVTGDDGKHRGFDPSIDMPRLAKLTTALPNLVLVGIDPIVSASRADSHKNAETRIGLQPVVDFAEERNVAIVGITHFTKNTQGRDPVERITGTLAYGALARVVMGVAADIEDKEAPRRLVRIASNIGPDGDGFEYTLNQKVMESHGVTNQAVVWADSITGSALRLISEIEGEPEKRGSKKDAIAFLTQKLVGAKGGISTKELRAEWVTDGRSWRSIENARAELPIERVGMGANCRWVWIDAEDPGFDDDL